MEYKSVLLTGVAGYICDGVADFLLNYPVDMVGIDNLLYGGAYMREAFYSKREGLLLFQRVDITDTNKLQEVLNSRKWDAVCHLAAIVGDGACAVDPERTIAVNENATRVIAEHCRDNNIKMVFASTCSVYGAANGVLNEESPTNPLSLYAGTKLNAEKYVREVPNHFIFRLGTVFGLSTEFARLRCDLIANILTYKAAQGQKLTVFGGEQWRPLIHVRDVAANIAEVVMRDYTPGTYILSHKNYIVLDIAKEVQRIVGGEMTVTDMKFEDLRNYQVDNSKMLAAGLEARTPLDQGVMEMNRLLQSGRIADVWNNNYHNEKWLKGVK